VAAAVISVLGMETAPTGQVGPAFGDPLPALTADQSALFAEGQQDFKQVETVADGLGPTFNNRGCAVCHISPATGGSSPTIKEVRAGRLVNGVFTNLPGGSLFQISAIAPMSVCKEVLPPEANVIAFRQTPPLFGMGLIEAIPEATIRAQADPNDLNGDGISGRAASAVDPATGATRLGRFGWKAQVPSLLGFSGDAYLNEMGITNDLFPTENAPNGDQARLQACDTVPDPEDTPDPLTGRRGIDRFANFMRFLGPPPRGAITADVIQGEALFVGVGCAKCHTPVMTTGPNSIAALDSKPVELFSDLLLHDVGTGDGIPQGDAQANEIRTPPLWGLRVSQPFLHDGSAVSIEAAILRHAGEASGVIQAFNQLARAEKDLLIAFLNSL
jgi:CxxC motif-containing protein (DUF1111 family)